MADEVERLRGKVALLTGEASAGAAPDGAQQPDQSGADDHEGTDTHVEPDTGSVLSGMARDRPGRHLRSDLDENPGDPS
jgi:hypothetical protein